jgi:hypothetical protein
MRAYWIMTQRWSLPQKDCAASIEFFLKTYEMPRYPSLSRETILEGFRLAKDLKHDIFDIMYLAFALEEKAVGVITTDTDFEKLCNQVGLKYINPYQQKSSDVSKNKTSDKYLIVIERQKNSPHPMSWRMMTTQPFSGYLHCDKN